MPSAITVRFAVGGTSEIDRAFRTVTQAADRLESRVKQGYAEEEKAAKKAAAEQEKIAKQLAKEQEKVLAGTAKAAAKLLADDVKAHERAERDKTREAERWSRQRETIQTNAAKLAYRLAEEEVRAVENAEKKKQAARERFGRAVGGSVSHTLGGLASGAMSLAGGALALGGGFSIADVVAKKFAAEKQANLLFNAATSGGHAPSKEDRARFMSEAAAVSIGTGMDKADVIGGALAYSRSARGGDFAGATNNMAFFAKMAKVTGADINDIASAAGTLQSQNADLGKYPQAMQQMLLSAYAQTKSGSVSMAEAAKQIGTLGSTRGYYQGDEARNQSVLMGLGQIAASGGSQEEIGTYIKNLSMEAGKHRKSTKDTIGLEQMGVKFNQYGQMESPEQMIGAVFKGTGGDMGKIEKLFGARGLPLFGELSKSFRDAGGGDKGVAAVQAQIAGVTQSTMSGQELNQQFEQSMSGPGEKFHAAIEKVSEVLEEKLTPYLQEFADKLPEIMPKVESAIDAVAKFGEWFADNPIKGVGAVVLAAISKDLAAAAIGEAIKGILTRALAGSAAGGGAPGTAGAGGMGVLGGIAAVGITAGVVGQNIGDYGSAKALAAQVRAGKISPEEAQRMVDQSTANYQGGGFKNAAAATGRATGVSNVIDLVGGAFGKDVGASAAGSKAQQDAMIANSKDLAAAIKEMTAALKSGGGGAGSNAPIRNAPISPRAPAGQ